MIILFTCIVPLEAKATSPLPLLYFLHLFKKMPVFIFVMSNAQ